MPFRILTAVMFLAMFAPRAAAAQTMVTFEMPVKITQLAPEIEKISLYCQIKSIAIVSPNPGQAEGVDEVPVLAGTLETTLRVVIAFPQGTLQAPVGKSASYTCYIRGRTATGLGGFSATTTIQAYVLKPDPAAVQGTFVW